MPREIKFRGKTVGGGRWVYGDLCHNSRLEGKWILPQDDPEPIFITVSPATVGQYTGLKDKNGVEIYEGDILRKDNCFVGYVKYCAPSFYRVPLDKWSIDHGVKETVVNGGTFVTSEVIGNIHDNHELLETISC